MKTYRFLLSLFLLVGTVITSVLLAQDSKLPKKAKLETILYKEADMIGVGYVYKKQFVENQHVTFIRKSFGDKHFSSYRIKEKDGRIYLHERKSDTWEHILSLEPLISGIYFTRNDTSYIKGIVKPYDGMTCEGVFIFCNIKYNNACSLSPLAKESGEFSLDMAGAISYEMKTREGYKAYGKKQYNGYSLKIDFPDKAEILTFESKVSKLNDLKYFSVYNSDCLKKIEPVKVEFINGDSFYGTVTSYHGNTLSERKLKPLRGRYTYSTGEEFIGEYSEIKYVNGRIDVPQGIITFNDGVVVSKDWLSKYDFTKEEWKQIYDNCNGLTEIRDMAVKLERKKRQQLIEKQREKRRLELAKQQAERERKQSYILKYGEYFGNMVYNKEFEVGMTKEMVSVALGEKEKLYKKSVTTFLGRRIERWEFDIEKVNTIGLLMDGLLGALAYYSTAQLMRACPTFEFVGDKLTGIYR